LSDKELTDNTFDLAFIFKIIAPLLGHSIAWEKKDNSIRGEKRLHKW
jgi:hypothetical protein